MSNAPEQRTVNMVHFPQKVATDPHALDEYLDGIVYGKQTLWLPATMWTSSGSPALALNALATTGTTPVLSFDGATDEFVWATWAPPKRWNKGTITYQVYWSLEGTGTDAVVWVLEAGAFANDDAVSNTFGAQSVTDNGTGADGDLQVTAESAAITVTGSPGNDELVRFTFFRDADNAADTATADAHMIGVKIFWTASAGSDD